MDEAFPSDSTKLQTQLDEITANTRKLVPAERLARLERVISDLRETGIEDRLLPVGAAAPDFSLRSAQGKLVRLQDLLALGPLVLKFFRGRWDPYDMTELEWWEALQPDLRRRRALLVALSPQTTRQNGFTSDRHHLTFPLLTDAGCAIASQYGLAYTVPEAAQVYYRSILVNVPFLNGDDTWALPLPATVIVGTDGRILFRQGFADPRRRPDPLSLLKVLDT